MTNPISGKSLFDALRMTLRHVLAQLEGSPIFISDVAMGLAYALAAAYLYVATGGQAVARSEVVLLCALIVLGQVAKVVLVVSLNRRGGEARAYESPDELVVTGFYRFSRNPVYLVTAVQNVFWSLLLVHDGGVTQQAPGLLAAAVAIPLVHFLAIDAWVIPREEATLRASHPQSYAAYCARVNRWIGWKLA